MTVLWISLAVSLLANVLLLSEIRHTQKKNKIRPQSQELQEFLVDLMAGPAMVAVARVDPSNILLRSPKQK